MRGLRVLVLELNLAREQKILSGAAPADQYDSFIALLYRPDFVAYLLRKYRTGGLEYLRTTRSTLLKTGAALQLLDEDRDRLVASGFLSKDVYPKAVHLLGDSHFNHTHVVAITPSAGKIIYFKPRESTSDQLVESIAQAYLPANLAPHIPRRLNTRGGYWQMHVSAQPVVDRKHWSRQVGALLALSYYLRIIDLHYENVIYDGNNLCLVDLECCFSPRTPDQEAMNVMDIALLPFYIGERRDDQVNNYGMLGGGNIASAPFPMHYLEHDGTSEAKLVLKPTPNQAHAHTPAEATLTPEPVPALLEEAFSATLALLVQAEPQIQHLIEESRPGSRVIVRPTQIYVDALRAASFPRYYIDASERREVLTRHLVGVGIEVGEQLLGLEVDQLMRGDIPKFVEPYRGGGDTSTHVIAIPATMSEHLRTVATPENRRQQVQLVRQVLNAAYATKFDYSSPIQHAPRDRIEDPNSLTITQQVGADTIGKALFDKHGPYWVNTTHLNGYPQALRCKQFDIYSGRAGTVWALSLLNRITPIDGYVHLEEQFFAGSLRFLEEELDALPIGLYTGLTGHLIAMANVRPDTTVWGAIDVSELIERCLQHVERGIQASPLSDIISGTAGVILAADRLREAGLLSRVRAERWQELCVDRLKEQRITTNQGHIAWPDANGNWLGGFSHGVSGIVWALSSLPDLLRDDELIAGAVAAQTSLRLGPLRWEDRRPEEKLTDFEAWCHGADGILLSAAQEPTLLTPLSTPDFWSDTIKQFMQTPIIPHPCVCHGSSGRYTVLRELREADLDPARFERDSLEYARDLVTRTLSDVATIMAAEGYLNGSDNHSLMLGLPGAVASCLSNFSPLTLRNLASD